MPPLRLPLPSNYASLGEERRRKAIAEAITWPRGPATDDPLRTDVYDLGAFRVAVRKPGKEFDRAAEKRNENDMLPCVFYEESDVFYTPSFATIFRQLWKFEDSLSFDERQLIGALLFRNAYMLDHQEVRLGVWRYTYTAEMLNALRGMPNILLRAQRTDYDLPMPVFLCLLDTLALQEDVKYYTLRGGFQPSIGRPNTMLTLANVMACTLTVVHPADLAYGMIAGRGVAPITYKTAMQAFGTVLT